MLYITKSSNKFARRGINTLLMKKSLNCSSATAFYGNRGIQFPVRSLTFAHKRMFSADPTKEGAQEVPV